MQWFMQRFLFLKLQDKSFFICKSFYVKNYNSVMQLLLLLSSSILQCAGPIWQLYKQTEDKLRSWKQSFQINLHLLQK